MTLKPNTWYWFKAPNREPYVEGVTELHELGPDGPSSRNYDAWLRTDAEGKISEFRQIGETHFWNKV